MRAFVICIAAVGCGNDTPPASVTATAKREVAEDALFRQEPRWLGGDGAYTIDLGGDRTLWLFGDSFVATSTAHVRTEATMVRNSVALMTGRDVTTATMQFSWRDGTPPTSFFAEAGDHWFWPSGGVRVPDGPLVVFASEIRATPGEGLGFAAAGLRAFRVADPSGDPRTWTVEPTTAHAPSFAPSTNVACTAVDGAYLVAVFTGNAAHDGMLARWPLTAVAAGDLAAPQWWTGSAWQPEPVTPKVVIPDAATECSLHYDAAVQSWVFLWSRGFGGTTVAIRTSPVLTGPYSPPLDVLKPPESSVANAFVYAGKAHPELRAADGSIFVTFADNSFTFSDVLDPAHASTLYWPHAVHLTLRR